MRIKQIHIVTDGDLVDLKVESLDDTLNVIQTSIDGDRDLGAEFQTSLSDVLHGKSRFTGTGNRSTANVTLQMGNSRFVRHLDRSHAHTRRWSQPLPRVTTQPRVTKQPLVTNQHAKALIALQPQTSQLRDSRVNDQDLGISKQSDRWNNFLSKTESLICGTDTPLASRVIQSYIFLTESSNSELRSELKSASDNPPAFKPSKHQSFGNSIARGKRCLLRARISEIETELAELARHQTNLPALLARRTHLGKRLQQPAPPPKTISLSRQNELLKERKAITEQHDLLVEQQQKTRQHLADIELDLQDYRPERNQETQHSESNIATDYQQLCMIRDRVIHDLTKLDRQCGLLLSEIKTINRRLEQATSHPHKIDTESSKHSIEQRSLELEMRRINGKIQCVERINWLEQRRLHLQEQLDSEGHTEPLHDLLEKANSWHKKLTGKTEGILALQASKTQNEKLNSGNELIVHINGQPEATATMTARYLACLAFRLAAAELLVDQIVSIPLIVRVPDWEQSKDLAPSTHTYLVDALKEYSRLHGQVILLTRHSQVTSTFTSAGAKSHHLNSTSYTTIDKNQHPLKSDDKANGGPPSNCDPPRALNESEQIPIDPTTTEDRLTDDQTSITSRPITLKLSTSIDQAKLLANHLTEILKQSGISTIGQLIETTDAALAEILIKQKLADHEIALGDAKQARAICKLAVTSTAINYFDAKVLVGAGINEPEELKACPAGELMLRTEKFLVTRKGQECLSSATASEISRLLTWLAAAHLSVHESLMPDKNPTPAQAPSTTPQLAVIAQRFNAESINKTARDNQGDATHREQEVVMGIPPTTRIDQCPLIDRNTAQRLMDAGYHDVQALTRANPELIVNELGSPRINPRDITLWQCQIRLTTEVPNLSSQQAKLLSHCEFTSLESIASTAPKDLHKTLCEYLKSGRGKRKFRGMKPPSTETVIAWTESCKSDHHRNAA
ncbi:MAG: DUF4332 domain-containing protein [Rubripirellula sp.]|nr:DUF4332 domain-containing protein [Rubripirellula sp.]